VSEVKSIVLIDLLLNKDDKYFVTHSCSVYPKLVSNTPEIYDTLYLTDFLLKFIYKIFVEMLIFDCDNEKICRLNFIIGYSESEKENCYKISSIRGRQGFTKLMNTMKLFILKNKLKNDAEIKESYHNFHKEKTDKDILKVYMNYDKISYQSDMVDDKYHIKLQPLESNCVFSFKRNGEYKETPYYIKFIKQFIDEHYKDIKEAFPIYKRLENIYRLVCLVNIMDRVKTYNNIDSFTINVENKNIIDKCEFIDNYPHSIQSNGGISLSPVNFIKVNAPFIPTIPIVKPPITNKVINICEIKRGLADAPIKVGALHHASLMIKSSLNEHYILEWDQSGSTLRKTNPDITKDDMKENGHSWTITSCQNMGKEYEPEGIKKLMDIITHQQPYNLIANNCQDVSRKVLDALGL
jgi:hypothetical protein